ncbi:MAG: zf-HC2 domain-containing protein [Chloroflexi bacterium]|nr:zf-HC2 domain-containing protein [Ktedonobacteraceae bacterium]MBV9020821.1 zf-HC2 domain-containing protein [Ktedonobacteraceae bacterium]MBV9706485.1 zf-HC2 domain-containing protein [Chloroflexota bacterium]
MHCSKAAIQLQLYLDHQLSLDQIRALETHLSSCPTCRQELLLLEKINTALQVIEPVVEPPDLTENIMQRVTLSPRQCCEYTYGLFPPSLLEIVTVVVLATITMLGIILVQPSLRGTLPHANQHDLLSTAFITSAHLLGSVSSSTLIWILWVIGTLLGVAITLALAGKEIRSSWFRGMLNQLPV